MSDGKPAPTGISRRPRVIPVIDVMGGVVVRAVAGRRAEYKSNRSALVASDAIETVASALAAAAGTDELYMADLDAIRGTSRPSFATSDFIERRGRDTVTWFDFGLRDAEWYRDNPFLPSVKPVIGFETSPPPTVVRQIVRQHPWLSPAFSIDLRGGRLDGDWRAWGLDGPADAVGLADRICELGVHSLIVLDLERVGVGRGTGTEEICSAIRNRHPQIEILTGGGVWTWDDVSRLGDYGIDGVLVATALHERTMANPG